jgi:hypothetical protein
VHAPVGQQLLDLLVDRGEEISLVSCSQKLQGFKWLMPKNLQF